MKKLIALSIAASMAATAASAKISFSLAIDALTNGGNPVNDSGLVVLVVDTGDDGFQLPSDGNLVSGNDEVVTYWDLADFDFEASKSVTLVSEGGVEWGSNWTEDDKLALFWFPTLGGSNGMSPGSDTIYGVFADAAGLASGDDWLLPANGTLLHSLKLFTATASELVKLGSGDQPDVLGSTAFAVNNPPSTETPDTPSLGVANGAGKSTLTWTATGSTSGYIVQRKAPGGEWETIGVASGSDTSFIDNNVKPGREYEYRLNSVSTFFYALSNSLSVVAERSTFANISSRAYVEADPEFAAYGLLNVGAQLAGNDSMKKIMALGFGPYHNENNNITTWVSDTVLEYEFIQGGTAVPVAINDDWMDNYENPGNINPDAADILATMDAVNSPIFFDNSKDAVILEDVPTGTNALFRATAPDLGGYIAVGLFDAEYDGGPELHDNRIVNLSSRGYLSEGGIFNGGVVIRGSVPKEVLAVIAGPFLRDGRGANPNLVLENPTLRIQRLNGPNGTQVILENDDWDIQDGTTDPSNGLLAVETDLDRLTTVLEAKNFQTEDMSGDAAVLVTLEPGNYLFRVFAEEDGVSRAYGSAQIALWEIEMD